MALHSSSESVYSHLSISSLSQNDSSLIHTSHSRAAAGHLECRSRLPRQLPALLRRCADLQLDVIAVQEIGDPALLLTQLTNYQLICSAGPSSHEAGVDLLLSLDLLPRCRTYLQSTTGRLAAAVLEYGHGKKLLIVSAYMPSGLDHASPTSDKAIQAHALYREIAMWSRGMQHVIVLGDLSETLSVCLRSISLLHIFSPLLLTLTHSSPSSGRLHRCLSSPPSITTPHAWLHTFHRQRASTYQKPTRLCVDSRLPQQQHS